MKKILLKIRLTVRNSSLPFLKLNWGSHVSEHKPVIRIPFKEVYCVPLPEKCSESIYNSSPRKKWKKIKAENEGNYAETFFLVLRK